MNNQIEIRELQEVEEFEATLDLQRSVFKFPELEVSPRRHHIVAKHAGGFTLGAFDGEKMVGFATTLPAFRGEERIFYSHMAAVLEEYQSHGIGTGLKWAQREKALERGVNFIQWTFQPVQSMNAYFNIEKLGTIIRRYMPNFYGTGFSNSGDETELESDRIYADWELESEKVIALSKGENYTEKREIAETIEIPKDWSKILNSDPEVAKIEQKKIKSKFQNAFSNGLICRGFMRGEENPKYLFYKD